MKAGANTAGNHLRLAGIRSNTIRHLGNAAIRLDRPIRWDPVAERVVGDNEAEAMLDRPRCVGWDGFAATRFSACPRRAAAAGVGVAGLR